MMRGYCVGVGSCRAIGASSCSEFARLFGGLGEAVFWGESYPWRASGHCLLLLRCVEVVRVLMSHFEWS